MVQPFKLHPKPRNGLPTSSKFRQIWNWDSEKKMTWIWQNAWCAICWIINSFVANTLTLSPFIFRKAKWKIREYENIGCCFVQSVYIFHVYKTHKIQVRVLEKQCWVIHMNKLPCYAQSKCVTIGEIQTVCELDLAVQIELKEIRRSGWRQESERKKSSCIHVKIGWILIVQCSDSVYSIKGRGDDKIVRR